MVRTAQRQRHGRAGLVTSSVVVALLVVSACATPPVAPFPEPIRSPKPLPEQESAEVPSGEEEELDPRVTPAPAIPMGPSVVDVSLRRMGEDLKGPPIGVSFNDAPLPVFINEVFNERLGLSFHISPGLREKTDLVTLRLADPVPPAQLFDAARRALQYYGVDIVQEEDGMLTFIAGQNTATGDIPLLVSGRTLPEVPSTHRVIFQLVPLQVVGQQQVLGMLKRTFAGRELGVEPNHYRNALLLMGNAAVVARALAMIEVLDQPLLRGRTGVIIETQYLDARKVAGDLRAMLKAEGYLLDDGAGAARVGIMILPLESINKLVAFASDKRTLAHIQEWAVTLDQRREQIVDDAWFTYPVQNAQAVDLAATLDEVVSRTNTLPSGDGAESSASRTAVSSRSRGSVVVDETQNVILFRGSGREWAQLRTVIEALDKPAPMVLIEAVIAEISLTDEAGSGIEFLARAALDIGRNAQIRTLDGLGVQANALSLTVDSAGNTRALLNLFYEDSRVMIRSLPKVVVRSGETAAFSSGNDIPAIVQLADSGTQTGGTTALLQRVQYRQTGVDLSVTPTAQANGSVNLEIELSLSEARPTASTSLTGSPTVLQRSVDTTLTLRDGGSTVMGGLVSDNSSIGQTGVPGLGRVPVMGRLFRTDTVTRDRTELLVMVIAYVIADHDEARELTERLKERLELHREYGE